LLAFGIWRWSDHSTRHVNSTITPSQDNIVAALDNEAALTTGRIWAQEEEQQQ
jgi:hypothetical protein